MSSKRKSNFNLRPWETNKTGGKTEPYTPITQSLEAVLLTCTPTAERIYINMRLTAKGSKDFKYPKATWERVCGSPTTFSKAKRELIDKGLIEEIENNSTIRKPNIYRFSTKWRTLNTFSGTSKEKKD